MSTIEKNKKIVMVVSIEPQALVETKMTLMPYFDVHFTASGESAITALDTLAISAVIICVGDKRDQAFDLFGGIYKHTKPKCVPILLLAEKGNDSDEIAAFNAGASDYTVRRKGTVSALVKRVNLLIKASEIERFSLSGGSGAPFESPEQVLSGKSILVAEDSEINRVVVSSMFEEIKDIDVEFAFDGKDTVEKFERSPDKFSIILMDILMPEMDGIEATEAIRRLDCENARDIPIIALTASDDEEKIKECLAAGMNGYLIKPMLKEELFEICAEYCRQR